jgi:hypothetical protein
MDVVGNRFFHRRDIHITTFKNYQKKGRQKIPTKKIPKNLHW